MDRKRLMKARKMLRNGQSMAQAAHECHVHPATLRRWIRNYELYGDSLWTPYPKEVKRE